jgi:hypothetical protein
MHGQPVTHAWPVKRIDETTERASCKILCESSKALPDMRPNTDQLSHVISTKILPDDNVA